MGDKYKFIHQYKDWAKENIHDDEERESFINFMEFKFQKPKREKYVSLPGVPEFDPDKNKFDK